MFEWLGNSTAYLSTRKKALKLSEMPNIIIFQNTHFSMCNNEIIPQLLLGLRLCLYTKETSPIHASLWNQQSDINGRFTTQTRVLTILYSCHQDERKDFIARLSCVFSNRQPYSDVTQIVYSDRSLIVHSIDRPTRRGGTPKKKKIFFYRCFQLIYLKWVIASGCLLFSSYVNLVKFSIYC